MPGLSTRLLLRTRPGGILLGGLSGMLTLAALFALPAIIAAPMDAQRAEREIRLHLARELTFAQLAEIRAAGLGAPGPDMARRWAAARDSLARLEFTTVQVRRFLIVPPLDSTRFYIARAAFHDAAGKERARYFSLDAESRLEGLIWIYDRAPWWWWLSI